jgi:hypothetical protein
MYRLLAQTPFEDIFKVFKIDPVRKLWELQWDLALDGQVYSALANVARGLALISLFIALIQFFREASEESRAIDGRNRSVTEFIWPIIVVFLLSNQASFLRASTKGLRDGFNALNDIVLSTNFGDADLATQFQRATQEGAAKEQIGAIIARCISEPTGQQAECFKDASVLADSVVDTYLQRVDAPALSPDFIDYVDKVKAALQQVADQKATAQANETIDTTALGAFATDVEQAKQRREQITQQVGFQTLIELTFLLTGLLAPLAVGLSLLPIRAKPLYAWFAAFASVGLTKVIFNFSLGVVASLLVTAKLVDDLLFTNLSGVILPVGSAGLFLVLTTALYRVIDSVKVQT